MSAFDPNAFDAGFDIGIISVPVLGPGFGFFGFDPFDSLLNAVCDILENQSTQDSYGHRPEQVQNFTVIATVACRVSTDAPGRPHEYLVEKESSVDFARVFMRVPTLPGGVNLDTHHWLRIGSDFFNIFNILDPGLLGHHLEVVCKIVTP